MIKGSIALLTLRATDPFASRGNPRRIVGAVEQVTLSAVRAMSFQPLSWLSGTTELIASIEFEFVKFLQNAFDNFPVILNLLVSKAHSSSFVNKLVPQ